MERMTMKLGSIWFRRVATLLALTAVAILAAPQASNAATTVRAATCKCYLHLSPSSGPPGVTVTIKGARFTAGGSVRIRFVDSKGAHWVVADPKNVKVASNGTFHVKVKVPKSATKGHGRFVAIEKAGSDRGLGRFIVT
jgi:hypothetical protein